MMLGLLMFDAAPPFDSSRGFSVAVDRDSQILVRLVETEAAIEFEILGSAEKAPSVAIDKRGNGRIDATEDFSVASSPDDADCFSRLLDKDRTSTCEPMPGGIVRTTLRRDGQLMTRFRIPKSTISIDQHQFGFVVQVWDTKASYGATIAAGKYSFGGKPEFGKAPNFINDEVPVPGPILPAIRSYESCLSRGTDQLVPLDTSKLGSLQAIPTSCASVRQEALAEGVMQLVASGAERDRSVSAMRGILDHIDASFARLVEVLMTPPKTSSK